MVRAVDDPRGLEQPRGKQEWNDEPHAIWYPRTTGIWQPVWLERVGATAVRTVRWRADAASWALDLEVALDGAPLAPGDGELEVDRPARRPGPCTRDRRRRTASPRGSGSPCPTRGSPTSAGASCGRPEHPVLLDAELVLRGPDGELDRAASYTAMRTVGVERGRVLLNGRPVRLRLVLDQGYWPESGLTPPGVDALYRDVELVQSLGFNGVRKHQKLEDPRFLRVADERGLLVWAELPSAYRFSARAAERLTRTWMEAIARDASHPCVIAWVPFNESWGVSQIATDPAQRALVAALYHLTRALDPTRPVIANDGWELAAGDILGVHDYECDPDRLARRYARPLDELLAHERPAGRVLLLDGAERDGRPVLLTEFGGIALTSDADEAATWGYDRVHGGDELAERYERLLAAVHGAADLAGFCYTQFTDTYQEANGLVTMAREPKAPVERIRAATEGAGR